jgi:hypothetical protein
MEITKTQKNGTNYTNDLDKIEAQIVEQEQTQKEGEKETSGLVKQTPFISDELCFKFFLSFLSLIICGPFAICDVYYGSTDISCLTQSQEEHNLNITLSVYLLTSGSIMLIFIGAFNIYLFAFDVNILVDKHSDECTICSYCLSYITRGFGISWLILGCVLFWAYTNISDCSQAVHDYMFARLIIGLISTGCSCFTQKDDK